MDSRSPLCFPPGRRELKLRPCHCSVRAASSRWSLHNWHPRSAHGPVGPTGTGATPASRRTAAGAETATSDAEATKDPPRNGVGAAPTVMPAPAIRSEMTVLGAAPRPAIKSVAARTAGPRWTSEASSEAVGPSPSGPNHARLRGLPACVPGTRTGAPLWQDCLRSNIRSPRRFSGEVSPVYARRSTE